MNTPAHLVIGAAGFARPERRGTLTAALLGSFAPDLSLYVMVAVSIWVMGLSPDIVFGQLYYSDSWQAVFAVDNSFVLWGALLAIAIWRKWSRLIAFAGAGVLHLCFDFPLHTHDARMHFWPVSDWVYHSQVSYWDSSAHAGVVAPLSLLFTAGGAYVVFQRFASLGIRIGIAILLVLEFASSGIWRVAF